MTTSFQSLIMDLSPSVRQRYEEICAQVEECCIRPDSVDLKPLSDLLEDDDELELLVGVHFLKLCFEVYSKTGQFKNAFEAYARLEGVFKNSSLVNELWAWIDNLGITEIPKPFCDLVPTNVLAQVGKCDLDFVVPADRFEFVRELATRGMAIVVLVKHRGLDQTQVLKALHPELRQNPLAVERFRREAKMLLKAAGPGIVRVIDSGESNGWPYFTMEYCPGGSLAERLVEGPLSQVQAAELIAAIASSLDSVHRNFDLVHRDIKPANIFYLAEGTPALGDFGLAHKSDIVEPGDDRIRRLGVMGTRGYIAPEILDESLILVGESDLDAWKRADVFSLGVTLYQCLTGRLPYQTDSAKIELDGVLKHNFIKPSDLARVDPVLNAICVRAIRKNPQARFSSARELANELGTWVASNSRQTPIADSTPKSSATPAAADSPVHTNKKRIAAFTAGTLLLAFIVQWQSGDNLRQTDKESLKIEERYVEGADSRPHLAQFTAKGWDSATAERLLRVAEPALQILKTHDEAFVSRTWERLVSLRMKGVSDGAIRERPHVAAAFILPTFPIDNREWISALCNSRESELVDDLLMRFPSPEQIPQTVEMLQEFGPVLRDLKNRNWIGAEVMLGGLGSDDASRTYGVWLSDILREPNQDKSLEYLAVAILHGRSSIVPQLKEDERFRSRFIEVTWPRFKSLAIEHRDTRFEYFAEPNCWRLLDHEFGYRLLDELGPGVCSLFIGDSAVPEDTKHIVATLLLEKRDVVLKCLLNERLRTTSSFSNLLRRDLTTNELSSLCAVLLVDQSDDGAIRAADRLARFDDEQLRHELENAPPGYLDSTPAVYLKVGWRLVSGERVYADEWANVAVQAIQDALTIATAGSSRVVTETVKGFKMGMEVTTGAMQSAKHELIAKLINTGQERLSEEEIRNVFQSPAALTKFFADQLAELKAEIDQNRGKRRFSTRRIEQFFATACGDYVRGRVATSTRVEFFRLSTSDNREYCIPRFERHLQLTALDEYFNTLVWQLTDQPELLPIEERVLLRHQLQFAWLLIQHPEASSAIQSTEKGEGL